MVRERLYMSFEGIASQKVGLSVYDFGEFVREVRESPIVIRQSYDYWLALDERRVVFMPASNVERRFVSFHKGLSSQRSGGSTEARSSHWSVGALGKNTNTRTR
jgi:hypothetical protein